MLATSANEHPFSWEDQLSHLSVWHITPVFIQRQPTHQVFLMFGRQVRMPIDLMYGTPSPAPVSVLSTHRICVRALESAYANVRERMDRKLAIGRKIYDRKVHGKP